MFGLERLKRTGPVLDQLSAVVDQLQILREVEDLKKYLELVDVQHFKDQQVIIAYNDMSAHQFFLLRGEASVMVPR